MSEDFDDWNPMSDDFESILFNSYSSDQTAANLPRSLMPEFGSEFCETRRLPKLYIDGFPLDLTETGLKNFLRRIGCSPLSVKILYSRSCVGRRFSFVEFQSIKEAQKAIELIKTQNLIKLSVKFASTEGDRHKREIVIEREKDDFHRLVSKQFEMKQKIDIGNCSAINSASNGDSSSMSPIQSESGSHESSQLDLLSPLAKSDKLLKVLEKLDDDCSYCSQKQPLEHLHFILSDQQVVDPTQMPALVDVVNVCQACERKATDMKLCSQCNSITYCDRNCQSIHWPRHRTHCRPDSNEYLSFNSTLNSSKHLNGNSSQTQRSDESIKTITKPSERSQSAKVVANSSEKMTKTTPQLINTIRVTPKESTPIVDPRESGDNSGAKAITREPKALICNESVLPKVVNKKMAKEEITAEKPKTDTNKVKITPIVSTVQTEVLNNGEDGLVLCFGRTPFDFYLQKSSANESMDLFADEIYKKMNDFSQLLDEDLNPGTLCGGIYSADGSCYRARIVDKINDKTYALYFIDFGNTEPVEKKDIKRLPQIFFSCKAQAIHCSLDRIAPKNKVWSKEAIAFFGDVGESNEYSKVKVFEKIDDTFKIDLLNRNGDSIRDLFVNKGFAVFTDEVSDSNTKSVASPITTPPRAPQTPVMSDSPVLVQSSPKVTFNKSSLDSTIKCVPPLKPMAVVEENIEISLKSFIESVASDSQISFMVTSVFNQEEFQYFGTVFDEEVQHLIEGLSKDYASGKPTIIPKENDVVVVQGSDGEFYRSYVLKVSQSTTRVFMFDSGYVEEVTRDKIHKLDGKFEKIPVYGVMFLPDTKKGARLIELTHTKEETIDGVLLRKEGRLFFRTDDVSIELLDYKQSIAHIKNFNADGFETDDESKEDDTLELPRRKLPLNKMLQSFALYQDPDEFRVFFVTDSADDCSNLMSLCAKYSTKFNDDITVNPLPGNVYLVRSSGDGEWYRALVYSATEDKIRVKYIDFGNEEEVDSQFVMELSGELQVSSITPLAIKCKVDKTKLSDDELKMKIQNATDGAYLLDMEVLRIEDDVHYVKVKK